jgi:hypothetical protein
VSAREDWIFASWGGLKQLLKLLKKPIDFRSTSEFSVGIFYFFLKRQDLFDADGSLSEELGLDEIRNQASIFAEMSGMRSP